MSKTGKGIDWSIGVETRDESALEHFWSTKRWVYSKYVALLLGTLALAIPVFVVYRGYFGTMDTRMERSLIVTFLLVFVFLKFPLGRKKWDKPPRWLFAIDILFILLAIGAQAYTIYSQTVNNLMENAIYLFGNRVGTDQIVGWILVLLVLDATRRSFGWAIVPVPLIFIAYALTADMWPGALLGAKASWTYLGGMLYSDLGGDVGLYGTGASVLLSMIFPFLLFGSLMAATKVGALFTSLATAVVGQYSGGPAKVAVVASLFFGTISGSASANVATTGAVTIPLMKKVGYKPAFAGAVEACASSGGYFTPPIMGAAAFLIAEFTKTPYLMVALYAALPALLYYLAIFIQVHLRAKKTGLVGLPKDELPSLGRVIKEGGYLVLPIVVLVTALALGLSITMVAVWSILAIIVTSFLSRHTRQVPRGILVMLESATSTTIGVSLAVVLVGVIEGAVTVSGLGMRLSMIVQTVAASNLILGLLVAGVVLTILGMGINAMLVYLIGYIFIIPALVEAGAPVMPVHIFVLLVAAAANITPPVAMAAFVAANIAGAPPMKTGFEAMKLGFAAFLVPFLLVMHPALLFMGGVSVAESIRSILAAILGIGFMAASFEGWLFRETVVWERLLLFTAGALLVAPQLTLNAVGFGLGLLVLARQWFAVRQGRPEQFKI